MLQASHCRAVPRDRRGDYRRAGDGLLLRTGAANFSASGLKRQDNDLIVVESANAAAAFNRDFDAQFARGAILPMGAIR